MILICNSCKEETNFLYKLEGPYYFVCPKCDSYHHYDQENKLLQVNPSTQKLKKNVLELSIGDVFSHQGWRYEIISISYRHGTNDTWVEYGAYNGQHFIFISSSVIRKNDTCLLSEYQLPADFDLKIAQKKSIYKNRESFKYNYKYKATPIYSSGLFVTDPKSPTIYYPFDAVDVDSYHFLSIEETDGDFSAFYGTMTSNYKLYQKFKGKKFEVQSKKKSLNGEIIGLAAYALSILMVLFILFNFEGLFKNKVIAHADAQTQNSNQKTYNNIVIPIDLTSMRETRINIEGVISSQTHTSMYLKLINESTSQIVYGRNIDLKANAINSASAIKALTKKAKPGKYLVWLEVNSSPNSIHSGDSTFEVDVDLKITAGQIIKYQPVLLTLLVMTFLFLLLQDQTLKLLKPNSRYSKFSIIKSYNYMYLIAFIVLIVSYTCYQIFVNYSQTTSNHYLEDADYKGRRYHYIHYSSSSHK